MRQLLLTTLVAIAALGTSFQAADAAVKYPYCIQLGADNTQCSYKTLKQCRAAAAGLDADCIRNPKLDFSRA
ncbi:hypothetical protein J2W51_003908 [Tardiphaga robiniae]|jgi:hypothetical protein|uniref:DUF3551 domain-containing protein n=1 Tax=Tardiphaga robiniae TaxID=943830 RepID=UPI002866BB8D|nr:DUF3551 domain-containing protein [Tardiphaga robiniae]MDR6661322.1 hypothetical protein [Tardiphaga robiniae]